ncbi:MAG: Asp-tRNA(Asn)/Glu-tRNA(Gln) amidotransferase subunit GatB [Candidatus Kerfeldbacteria bacterium]
MDLEAVIGLEIHVQLKTKSKMFCSCDNASDGAEPNTLVCPVCTGHPGTLPVPNKQAIEWAVIAATALGCTIPEHSKFDRKHYFYPDLPKGYQISQYDEPIGVHGNLSVVYDGLERIIGITRLHLEEDVGKLTHVGGHSFVDFNRAGTPLMEIVTEPDIRTPQEAKAFMQELRLTMRYLSVSNADMEKGELRCDANVSLRKKGDSALQPKTEVKNINSFRNVERALAFEIERQRKLWEQGKPPKGHETRGWDATAQVTIAQRRKETSSDYRYFPEPDIPPLHFTPEFLKNLVRSMPELPSARRQRFVDMYGLTPVLADSLVRDTPFAKADDRPMWKYFEEIVTEFREYAADELGDKAAEEYWSKNRSLATQFIAKFLTNRISAEHRTTWGLPVPPADLARLLWMAHEKTITLSTAAELYETMRETKKGPHTLMKELGIERTKKVGDAESIEPVVKRVIDNNPELVKKYRSGKTTVLQFLVGKVMAETKGTADAQAVRKLLEIALKD